MSDIKVLTPDERLKRVRNDEIKANVGTVTSLAGLTAAGLVSAPTVARSKVAQKIARKIGGPAKSGQKKVAGSEEAADKLATKVFLYGAAPGATVGLAHAATARQDAKAAKRRIRSDGSLRPADQIKKAVSLRLTRRARVRQGGLVRQKTGGSTYRRGGVSR